MGWCLLTRPLCGVVRTLGQPGFGLALTHPPDRLPEVGDIHISFSGHTLRTVSLLAEVSWGPPPPENPKAVFPGYARSWNEVVIWPQTLAQGVTHTELSARSSDGFFF